MKAAFRYMLMALFLSRAIAFAGTHEGVQDIAQTPEWLALLHHENGKSRIDDEGFFLARDGRHDPLAELEATLAAFEGESSGVQCRFPARFAYLSEAMPERARQFRTMPCQELAEYEAKVPFDRVSMVFATEYIPNPTTMMGHLFLKMDGEAKGRTAAHALSFYADLNKVRSTAEFIVDSLFTGTDGVFLLEPYQTRRDSYVRDGKRSMWEFELKLTAKQRRMLKLHAWEMRGTSVDYDLRANNCGSAVIRLLMAADPSLERVLYKPYVTPGDLLRKLEEEGFLTRAVFVPSELYALRNPDGQGGVVVPKGNVTNKTHAAGVAVEHAWEEGDGFMKLGLTPAYNQLMSPNDYAEAEYEVNLFALDVGVSRELDTVNVQKMEIIGMKSLLPVRDGDASLSRSLSVGVENAGYGMETGKLFPKAFGGVGYTVSVLDDSVYAYGMLNGGYSYYGQDHVLSVVPEVGLIVRQGDFGKAQVGYEEFMNSATYKYDSRFVARQSVYVSRDVSLNASYEHAVTGRGDNRDRVGVGVSFRF